jgi:hypothetical protein
MQLPLRFLEPTPTTPAPPSQELCDVEARTEALKILARLIAQAFQTINRTEAADE